MRRLKPVCTLTYQPDGFSDQRRIRVGDRPLSCREVDAHVADRRIADVDVRRDDVVDIRP